MGADTTLTIGVTPVLTAIFLRLGIDADDIVAELSWLCFSAVERVSFGDWIIDSGLKSVIGFLAVMVGL